MHFRIFIMSACVAAVGGTCLSAIGATAIAQATCVEMSVSSCSDIAVVATNRCAEIESQSCYKQRNSNGNETGSVIYSSCLSCPSGYTKQTQAVDVCSNVADAPKINVCCASCDGCVSDTTWSSYDSTREVKVSRSCNCGTCKTLNLYRCKAGYYGSGSSTSNCTLCPENDVRIMGSSEAGSTKITQCFVNRGVDSSGNYDYTEPCYYTQDSSIIIGPLKPDLEVIP